MELCHRSGDVSAGQLHDEVQSAGKRICIAARGDCGGASLSAGGTVAGLAGNYAAAAEVPAGDHRHGGDHAAAGGRRAWRVHRNSAGARVSHRQRAIRGANGHHSRLGARDESRHCGDLRLRGGQFQVEPAGRHRRGGARAGGERRYGRADADESRRRSASSKTRFIALPTFCTRRARCSIWMAPT